MNTSSCKPIHIVRSATLDDLLFVASWIRTADDCERWAGTQVAFPIDIVALPDAIGFAERNAYVLTLDGTVVAFGQVVDKPQNRQHLAKFIVSPLHRGRGYGRKFLQELLSRSTGDRVSLNVNENNLVAASLYGAAGFLPAERPVDQQGSPRTHYMEWNRASSG
jgi:ribosomal protein S18 acetylase RimI-like enzyme